MIDNEIITSRDNAKLKLARSVRDGRESGLIFIEGARLSGELLRSPLDVTHALVSTEFADSNKISEIRELLRFKRLEPIEVAANLFSSISDTENSQGIILLAERPKYDLNSILGRTAGNEPIILLHKANNPSNLGAVMRTAEAAGAAGVITTAGSADAWSPKAVRASMGSTFRMPIIECAKFSAAVEWARSNGYTPTAADISGSASYADADWKIARMLIMGSEAHGLSERELEMIDEKIVIPMEYGVESLNLAVSAGIILFEAKRQRG